MTERSPSKLNVFIEELTRCLEVSRIVIDYGEMRRRQKFPQNHRGPRKESAAYNGGAGYWLQLREQRSKSSAMPLEDEAL